MLDLSGINTFYNIDLILGVISALVAVFIAGYALKGYMLTRNRTSLFFSAAFMLIAAGMLSRVIFDYLVKFELNLPLVQVPTMTPLQGLMLFFSIFFLSSGYMLLLVLFFKIRSRRFMALLIVLLAVMALTTANAYLISHVVPAILLFFGLTHTTDHFFKRRNKNAFLVLSAFIILFASELLFLLVLKSISFYFIGSILRVVAYSLLLANVLLVLKR